jgi:hypothetical protein
MDTALETRIRAAGAELGKPGHWRIALSQLDQATAQILASPDFDRQTAQLALEQLHSLYSWAGVMQNHELRQLNHDILQLTTALEME